MSYILGAILNPAGAKGFEELSFNGPDYQLAARLVYEDFDQGRGVQVEDQRRSSMTISAAVLSPRTVGASS